MTDWERTRELFRAACDLPAEEQHALLVEACDGDDELLGKVEALLEMDRRRPDEMERIVARAGAEIAGDTGCSPTAAEAGRVGLVLGRYSLVQLIDAGGMGAVYLGRRADDEFEKVVAVKLLRAGTVRNEDLDRFLRERQALASLDHPNIARLIDGGTSAEGVPYLVMEYVEGERIDLWCDRHEKGIEERLELFCAVCEAVHHAHKNLVIHRDIKPSNILVTAEGVPKLLDFGIAKILDRRATQTTQRTFTPEYASPEQLRGEAITTATDVYSLGVLLYELLTGSRPFQAGTRPTPAFARDVLETDPPRPSTQFGRSPTQGRTVEEIAAARRETPARLVRRIRGDLDRVVLTALSKDVSRRYDNVERLEHDVRNHLLGLPVDARGDGLVYRLGKYLRRNKAAVAVGLSASVAVAAAGIAQYQALERDREVARKVDELSWGYITSLVDNPSIRTVSSHRALIAYLDEVCDLALSAEHPDPHVETRRLQDLVRVFRKLEHVSRSRRLWERLLELGRQLGDEELQVEALVSVGKGTEALELAQRIYDEPHPMIATAIAQTGAEAWESEDFETTFSRYLEAIAMLERCDPVEVREKLVGAHCWVAARFLEQGNAARSRGHADQAVALAIPGPLSSSDAYALFTRSYIYQDLAMYDEALRDLERLISYAQDRLAFDHPNLLAYEQAHAVLLKDMGRPRQAVSELEAIIERMRAARLDVGDVLHFNLARAYADSGLWKDARESVAEALALHPMESLADQREGLKMNTLLGRCLIHMGAIDEAMRLLEATEDAWQRHEGYERWERDKTATVLGHAYVRARRFREGENLLADHAEALIEDRGPDHYRSAQALMRFVDLYTRWGKPELAAEYLARITPRALEHGIVRETVLPWLAELGLSVPAPGETAGG